MLLRIDEISWEMAKPHQWGNTWRSFLFSHLARFKAIFHHFMRKFVLLFLSSFKCLDWEHAYKPSTFQAKGLRTGFDSSCWQNHISTIYLLHSTVNHEHFKRGNMNEDSFFGRFRLFFECKSVCNISTYETQFSQTLFYLKAVAAEYAIYNLCIH